MDVVIASYTPFSILHTLNYVTICARSQASLEKSKKSTSDKRLVGAGYGGHFRAVQAFKYLGQITEKSTEDNNKNDTKI